jgi:hypothetical protein
MTGIRTRCLPALMDPLKEPQQRSGGSSAPGVSAGSPYLPGRPHQSAADGQQKKWPIRPAAGQEPHHNHARSDDRPPGGA